MRSQGQKSVPSESMISKPSALLLSLERRQTLPSTTAVVENHQHSTRRHPSEER
jgi:hypothetical protein